MERTGRILFWPDSRPTAYSLTPEVADLICVIKARIEKSDLVFAVPLAFALFFPKSFYRSEALQEWFLRLTHHTLSLGLGLRAVLLVFLVLIVVVRRVIKDRAVREFLKFCSFVEQRPRSKAEVLKPSFLTNKNKLGDLPFSKKFWVLIGGFLIYPSFDELRSPYVGNSIVAGAFLAFLAVLCLEYWRRQRTGLRPEQVKTFMQEKLH